MKHQIIVDKENKVLKLKVSVPKRKLMREPNFTVQTLDAWELVKNTKIDGFVLEYKKNSLLVDNWNICNYEGEFVFPLKEISKPKPARQAPPKPSKPKSKSKSKPKSKPKTSLKKAPVPKAEDAKAEQ
tara:strand:+ start:104 stop:487 length:384 start_codon:yes stop_codon:yes gene_type:complete